MQIMQIATRGRVSRLDEGGFTLIELLVSAGIAVALLALIAGIITSQGDTFSRQIVLGQMQANGRDAVDFLSRSIQNAGYNISRGSRFLAASDHYISTVFDEDDDGVIQSDEIITLSVSNATGQTTETFLISPYFDFDDDGRVGRDETREYEIELTLHEPPFNLYLFTPGKTSSAYTKHMAARNIDNLVIRYYDKNNEALPPDDSIPYTLTKAELSQIRKIEFEITVRSKAEDPNEKYINSGSYPKGSVAAQGGPGSYNDRYHRQNFKAVSSPRNLVTAPFGKIALSPSPNPINCPRSETVVTASVIDLEGDPVSDALDVTFNASSSRWPDSLRISPELGSLNRGEASTTLSYDWSSPSLTTTVSASTQVDFEGKKIPVFNAIPVTFDGQLLDDFDAGLKPGWVEYPSPPPGSSRWLAEDKKYRTRAAGDNNSTNGCELLKNYEVTVDVQKEANHAQGDYFGLILRSPASLKDAARGYYVARVVCSSCAGDPASHSYTLELVDKQGSMETVLTSVDLEPVPFPFITGEDYTLKASVTGETLAAKFWKSSELEPSDDPDEPPKPADPLEPARNGRTIAVDHASYPQGKIGLTTNTNINTFDNVAVRPPS